MKLHIQLDLMNLALVCPAGRNFISHITKQILIFKFAKMNKQQIFVKSNFKQISDNVDKAYDNFILGNVNDHCLRIAVMQGEYRWHYHANTDELFVVLEGELKIEIKDNDAVFLKPGEFIKIPSKTIHKTSAAARTVNICFEKNADDTIFVD